MLWRMASKRTLIGLEFVSPEGYRLEFDGIIWRLHNPRQLGQKDLEKARALLERAEECLPPVIEGETEPPTMDAIGNHVAITLGLRINHHRFKKHR